MRAEGRACRAVLVGECLAPYTPEMLSADIKRLGLEGIVELPGVLSGRDKWSRFASADLFAFPSVAPLESFGLVLVEAMMWALPVVAADWRGASEVVGEEPGGICFKPFPDLTTGLTDALREMLRQRDQWPAWSSRNRARYEELFRAIPGESKLAAAVERLSNAEAT
jgi:glycosyltransferase involved in cell wall biosynthesis